MKMNWLVAALPAILLLSCSGKNSSPSPQTGFVPDPVVTPVSSKVYTFDDKPTWADEFDGTTIDATKWGYDIGAGGWGNHELEYYTNGTNSAIVNGELVITANKQSYQGAAYTSARMVSKGDGNFLYGRIEVRAKIPGGKGAWPAIWMLSTDNAYGDWPKSGEIDMMEHVGQDPNNIYVTVHTGAYNHTIGTQKGITYTTSTATSDYHIYRLDWTPDSITEYIDGVQQFQFKNEGTGYAAWPFDKRFHMMLNIAVGGDWGGAQGVDDTSFPATMQVDYVRYYKVNNL